MRRSILTGLLDAARDNLRFTSRVALFEVGYTYESQGQALPLEPWRIGLLLAGPRQATSWRGEAQRPMDVFDAKGVVEGLLAALNATAEWQPGEHPSMHPARAAMLLVGGMPVGHVGELHPVVRERWDLGDGPVAVADLDLDALAPAASAARAFQPVSPFPAIREDLAVVVDELVPAAEVATAIRSVGGKLLVDVALFDVYRGPQIGQGKKSLAWSLVFQAPDRTLTSEESANLRGKIVRSLEHRLGATIRE